MKKIYTIAKSKKTIGKFDILLDYLLKSRAHLKTMPRKVFQNGGKKIKFILPKANPKAAPVQF